MALSDKLAFSAAICIACCLIVHQLQPVEAKGAGRAFPIDAENYIIERFKSVNPLLEWDSTNFLVDLSGQYATCSVLERSPGSVNVDRVTPSGESIVGVVDYTPGQESHIQSVSEYIRTIVDRWQNRRVHDTLIRSANRIGCSVRPGCQGNAVVACLFSPGRQGVVILTGPTQKPGRLPRPTQRPQEQRQQTLRTIFPGGPGTARPETGARAFTREQYDEAESTLSRKWDRSYYLENLSGMETNCSMIGTNEWPFNYMKRAHQQPEVPIVGQFGSARNLGSTPDALREIVSKMKPVYPSPELVGCSLIADCISRSDQQMYVVVACLFADNKSGWAFEPATEHIPIPGPS